MLSHPEGSTAGAPELPPFWRQGNLRVLGWFGALLAADLLLQSAVFSLTDSMFLPVAAASILAVVLPLALMARTVGGSLASEFDLGRVPAGAVLWSVVAASGALLPTSFLADQSSRLHPVDAEWLQFYIAHLPRGPLPIAVAVLTVVFVAPLAEELLFRGVLQRLSRRLWGPAPAIVLSALVFAIAHGQPWYLFGLVGLGLLLAWVYEVTGSLTPCVVLHGTHNAVSLVLLLTGAGLAEGAAALELDLWLVAVSLAALLLASTRLARYGP